MNRTSKKRKKIFLQTLMCFQGQWVSAKELFDVINDLQKNICYFKNYRSVGHYITRFRFMSRRQYDSSPQKYMKEYFIDFARKLPDISMLNI